MDIHPPHALFGHVAVPSLTRVQGEILRGIGEGVYAARMSPLGQKRKSEAALGTSALNPTADVIREKADIEFGMSAPEVTPDIKFSPV